MTARSSAAAWAVLCVAVPTIQLMADAIAPGTVEQPRLLFWIVVVAATQCVLLAAAMLVHSYRNDRAETALLGAFVLSVSVLPLAHGLLTPGVLYGPNPGAMASVQIAVLVGALALVPFAGGRSAAANRLARRWRWIAGTHVVLSVALFALFLIDPDVVPAAETGSAAASVVALGSLVICLALSARFRRLAVMADNSTVLGLAFGLVLIGSAPMVFVVGEPYGAGFWLAHLLDIIGVTAVSVLALIGYRRGRTMHALLAPIDAVTPLQAVEIGLDPLVHEWVAAIDAKDAQTRDHVVRTSRLAVQTASKMGLSPTQIRRTGIGAILHDVGKLDIPDDILAKPGRLTDDERAVMQTHAARGAAKLAVSPVLGDAAPIVAAHHERIDGRGYPMGLAGDRIPIEARVIAACDAYDAITNNRHYRRKMSHDRAEAILREHAGSQWDGDVVEALLAVVRSERVTTRPVGLESVGRNGRFETPAPACVCHDAVPEVVAAE